ncbi:MAG: aldose 1-epimerase family protein [Geminicoccaceae bacterium]
MPTLLGRSFTRAELARHVGDSSQLFGTDLYELADGPERGVRVVRLRTGSGLSCEILLDRGMDPAGLDWRGVPLGWRSPTLFRSPWLHEHDSEDGMGWLRSFSGLMNSCGLDHTMGPEAEDSPHFNYPARPRVRHGLHGRAAYLPARLIGHGERWEGDRCFLYVEGEVRQAAMYGEFLVLRRKIEAEVGSDTLTIEDVVTSHGFHPTPHALLYHVNLGFPVVAEGTRLVAPLRRTRFTSHDAARAEVGPLAQTAPLSGFVEQVYEHELAADAAGNSFAALVNPSFAWSGGDAGLGFVLEWDSRTLPAFYQWQNLQEGNYVVGIEPATTLAGSRAARKERGEIVWLGHGEQRRYRLSMTPVAGAAAIDRLEERSRALLGAAG